MLETVLKAETVAAPYSSKKAMSLRSFGKLGYLLDREGALSVPPLLLCDCGCLNLGHFIYVGQTDLVYG